MRRSFGIGAVLVFGGWLACADYGTAAAPQNERGTAGGICFENSTCFTGLDCVLGHCFIHEAGVETINNTVDASNDGSDDSGMSQLEAGTIDGPTNTACGFPRDQSAQLQCPSPSLGQPMTCPLASICCAGSGCGSEDSCGAVKVFKCFSTLDCSAVMGSVCCLAGTLVANAAGKGPCAQTLSNTTGAACATTCGHAGELQICSGDADCGTGRCKPINLPAPGQPSIGVCQDQ
jgi:hypothetical protein